MSLASVVLLSERLFTSAATTEKPRPDSPARAASMAAFSAKRSVWWAINWMLRAMVPIRPADCMRPSSLSCTTSVREQVCSEMAMVSTSMASA